MTKLHSSFEPIAENNPKLLILGTMPGALSLKEQQYYAHPQNMFWKILFRLFEQTYSVDYQERIGLLVRHHIALWDVLQHCEREGSLDSNIMNEIPNDFTAFFKEHIDIKHIIFNGQPAQKFFKKYIRLSNSHIYHLLPSTSPAHATKSFETKLQEWKLILNLV